MSRHSTGQSNYRLSKSLTIAIVAIVVIIVLIIVWALNRSTDSTDTGASGSAECTQGDLDLPIGGDSVAVAAAVEEYNSTNPSTRDFCVTATQAADDQAAATYLFAGTKAEAASEFEKTGAVAGASEDSWPQVASLPAGIASAEGASTELSDISFPVASNSAASAAVALAVAPSEDEAALQLAEDAETTIEDAHTTPAFATVEGAELPEGYSFAQVEGASVPVWAISTNASADVSEDQARAGADFVAHDFGVSDSSAGNIDAVVAKAQELRGSQEHTTEQAAEEPATPEVPAEQASGQPSDTMINLDTSANMDQVVDGTQESYHTILGRTLADLARETGSLGNQVALNNYSSPLNPGVTKGWRANVSFPDQSGGENAAGAIVRMGTGGVPLTRASVVAAAQIASESASASGRPVRVVVITSGSAGDYQDDAFLADLDAAAGDNVTIHMVHVGHGGIDQVLNDWVLSHGGTVASATTADAINSGLRSAFGF